MLLKREFAEAQWEMMDGGYYGVLGLILSRRRGAVVSGLSRIEKHSEGST